MQKQTKQQEQEQLQQQRQPQGMLDQLLLATIKPNYYNNKSHNNNINKKTNT